VVAPREAAGSAVEAAQEALDQYRALFADAATSPSS
jgi:hypothetical protein